MKRKVLQDFAHVCCQRFLTSLSNSDRINFVIFGSGRVSIDFLSQRCTHERLAISPLGYCLSFRDWLSESCQRHHIKLSELTEVKLDVQMIVQVERKERPSFSGWLTTTINFECSSRIVTDEKIYAAKVWEVQTRGLGQILHDHYY